jgi:hypothetical protein
MNLTWHPLLRGAAFSGLGLLLLALCGCGSDPATPASAKSTAGLAAGASVGGLSGGTGATNNSALAVRSVFHNTPQSGRDPFFPDSRRSLAQSVEAAPIRMPTISYLKLTGIRASTSRPMALINRTCIAPGEERDVAIVVTNAMSKAEIQKVSVRCMEIRHDSVVIKIGGEHGVKELRLAQAR